MIIKTYQYCLLLNLWIFLQNILQVGGYHLFSRMTIIYLLSSNYHSLLITTDLLTINTISISQLQGGETDGIQLGIANYVDYYRFQWRIKLWNSNRSLEYIYKLSTRVCWGGGVVDVCHFWQVSRAGGRGKYPPLLAGFTGDHPPPPASRGFYPTFGKRFSRPTSAACITDSLPCGN